MSAPASQTGCSSLRDQAPAGLDHTASPPRAKKKHWQPKNQFFIVFSPEGENPPVVVHQMHKGALWAAHDMAKKHPGKSFFVMGSMSRPCIVEAEIDPDALTGCADDQTWADVPTAALRAAVGGEQ